MSLSATMIDAMLAAGCTAEQLAAVMKADIAEREAVASERRAKDAERQRRHRESRDVTVTNSDSTDPSLSLPPNENISNPPAHTHPDNNTRARKGGFPAPNGVTEKQWDGFLAQRKKRLTPRAYELLTGKLDKLAADGWPPGDMIDRATERGWETVFAPKDFGNETYRGHSGTGSGAGGKRPDAWQSVLGQVANGTPDYGDPGDYRGSESIRRVGQSPAGS